MKPKLEVPICKECNHAVNEHKWKAGLPGFHENCLHQGCKCERFNAKR